MIISFGEIKMDINVVSVLYSILQMKLNEKVIS